MTEFSYPWDLTSPGHAGPYDSAQWANAWRSIINGSLSDQYNVGVFLRSGDGSNAPLQVAATSPATTQVRVFAGEALVQGKFYTSDETELISIPANGNINPRIDRIVLRATYASQTVVLAHLQGDPAASPVAPALTQTEGVVWEIPLAQIAVDPSFSDIQTADITDEREYSTLPSLMGGTGFREYAVGDVIVASATDTLSKQNLLDGQTLVRDSSLGDNFDGRYLGLEQIQARTVLGSPAASVTLSSIPAKYRDLLLVVRARSSSASGTQLTVIFNSDTGNNYASNQSTVDNTGTGASSEVHDQANIVVSNASAVPASTSNFFGNVAFWIHQYRETTQRHGWWSSSRPAGAAPLSSIYAGRGHWAWENVADVISSITFALNSGNLDTGTEYMLYGIGRDA